jgi:hypothetical protein
MPSWCLNLRKAARNLTTCSSGPRRSSKLRCAPERQSGDMVEMLTAALIEPFLSGLRTRLPDFEFFATGY